MPVVIKYLTDGILNLGCSGLSRICHTREVAERFGSGDGERKTLLTRQIAFEPLPASVLFGLVFAVVVVMVIQNFWSGLSVTLMHCSNLARIVRLDQSWNQQEPQRAEDKCADTCSNSPNTSI